MIIKSSLFELIDDIQCDLMEINTYFSKEEQHYELKSGLKCYFMQQDSYFVKSINDKEYLSLMELGKLRFWHLI